MTLFARTEAGRLGSIHTNHRRIAAGAVWVTLFVLASKIVVVGREMVIASRYGVSGIVDAYQLSFSLLAWLPMIVCSIGTSVLVPRLVGLRNREERARFASEFHTLMVVTGVCLALLTLLVGPWVTAWFGRDLDASTQALSATMVRQLAPVALLIVLAGYHAIRLQALERHAYSFLEATPSAGIIIFILLLPSGLGAAPLIWGTVAGATAQVVILARMTRSADAEPNTLAFRLRSPVWNTVSGPIAIMAMGQVVMATALPIDQYFAAGLGDGSLSIMGYANRLVGLATAVGAVVLARALLPVLSDVAADGGHALGRRQVLQWSCIMLAMGTSLAVLGWIMAPWGVATFLERGAFSPEHTLAVASVLRFGVIQLPFYFAGIALVQWFAAFGRFDLLLGASVAGMAAKISLNYLLTPQFGLAGIMMATACMYVVTLLFLTLYLMGRP